MDDGFDSWASNWRYSNEGPQAVRIGNAIADELTRSAPIFQAVARYGYETVYTPEFHGTGYYKDLVLKCVKIKGRRSDDPLRLIPFMPRKLLVEIEIERGCYAIGVYDKSIYERVEEKVKALGALGDIQHMAYRFVKCFEGGELSISENPQGAVSLVKK